MKAYKAVKYSTRYSKGFVEHSKHLLPLCEDLAKLVEGGSYSIGTDYSAKCGWTVGFFNHGDVPDETCKCGFYSAKNVGDLIKILFTAHLSFDAIFKVEIWGKIIEGDLGYRSEYVRFVQLIQENSNERYDYGYRKNPPSYLFTKIWADRKTYPNS